MSRPRRRRVLVVAGEASGDRHGGGLVQEARALDDAIEFEGVGGRSMRAAGVRLLHDVRELAVVGISEVLERLPAIRHVMRDLKHRLHADPPDAVLLIDAPDFNLRVAKAAHARGVPVVYFISPQVWAWRARRVELIRRVVRRMIVLFPFEQTFYRDRRMAVTFVGHPLVETARRTLSAEEARRKLGLDARQGVYGLLPGSRNSEIRRHLEPMLAAARLVLAQQPDASFLVPLADTVDPRLVETPVRASGLPVVALGGAFDPIVDACDAALCASGTATLELAMHDVPAVVVYRTSWPTWIIGRMLVRVPHVSLVNLIAGRRLLPELIQRDFEPARAAAELLRLGRPGAPRDAAVSGLREIRAKLGAPGAYRRAAQALLEELG